MNRRTFLKTSTAAAALPLAACGTSPPAERTNVAHHAATSQPTAQENMTVLFQISLAQWSLHRAFFGGELDALDFAKITAERYDIHAIEYVNSFFKEKAADEVYLGQLKSRAADHGVKSLLIMIDGEGALGDPDSSARAQAAKNHHQWIDAAKFLGCHSIRVNAGSSGSYEEQQKLAADGLRQLVEHADQYKINVIVENHGGLSSNGKWLAGVMDLVDHPRMGTLPDFGNFRISGDDWYDRYTGVTELMPYAKAVSAKSNDFDADGNEVHSDFERLMRIVLDAGYRGYVGIEYEGEQISEHEGVIATRKLLERVHDKLATDPAYTAGASGG